MGYFVPIFSRGKYMYLYIVFGYLVVYSLDSQKVK